MQDHEWAAIVDCDPSYDGTFFYAVKTTGVYCRPSCRSRTPRRHNVYVFPSAKKAQKARFRPCKRCRPDQFLRPDEELAQCAARFLDDHFNRPLTLAEMARQLHVSPYHLHHIFKRVRQMTPASYLATRRISAAKRWLLESDKTIKEIAGLVGFSNSGHFSTVFRQRVGITPTAHHGIPFLTKEGAW